jgi:conjugative transfer signal peptidase TraF
MILSAGRLSVIGVAAVGTVALAWPAMYLPVVRIIYNASDSAPRGWYRASPPESLHVGSFVLARLPTEVTALAAERHYLPVGIPLLKRIGAMAPQTVCVSDRVVSIDGVPSATALTMDWVGRRLPVWSQCRPLHDDELFLLSTTNQASFDSRYFGPVSTSAVIGTVQPLWTWSTP